MRTLTMDEMAAVSGGGPVDAFIGTMGETIHEGGIRFTGKVGAVSLAFAGGIKIGSAINEWFEKKYGQSIGFSLYDKTH